MNNQTKNIAVAMRHAGYTIKEIKEAVNHEILNLTEQEKKQTMQKLLQHERKKSQLKIIK